MARQYNSRVFVRLQMSQNVSCSGGIRTLDSLKAECRYSASDRSATVLSLNKNTVLWGFECTILILIDHNCIRFVPTIYERDAGLYCPDKAWTRQTEAFIYLLIIPHIHYYLFMIETLWAPPGQEGQSCLQCHFVPCHLMSLGLFVCFFNNNTVLSCLILMEPWFILNTSYPKFWWTNDQNDLKHSLHST